MVILQAILLGIIEGLTEFLPISSTGHLLVSEKLLGYKDAAELFTVVIQIGAIIAVLWYYRKDLLKKISELLNGKQSAILFWKNWVIATIPAGLAGLVLSKSLHRFTTMPIVACTLVFGGIAILIIEHNFSAKTEIKLRQRSATAAPAIEKLSTKQSLQVGLFQILALVPGVSRSGATIMGGLLSGIDRVTATAFSFYLSIPILVLAAGYKLFKDHSQLSEISGGSTALIVGVASSFITALLVINWFLKYVSRHDFKIFAYYRIVLGLIILASLALF